MREDIASLRNEYQKATLDKDTLSQDPFSQFEIWFQEALQAPIKEANAMVLSTSGKANEPSSRVVLLKDVSAKGFTFFTNYDSQKGSQIAENNRVSLLFPWIELERQVIVKGAAKQISKKESEMYFHSRPKSSQIGAHISPQSQEIPSRKALEDRLQKLTQQYEAKEVPIPSNWGGFLVVPTSIEFWQGRPNRLHDRMVYERLGNQWKLSRLAP